MHIPKQKSVSFQFFLSDLLSYRAKFFKSDLFAAIAIALMTIPQSIAYSLLAGLPPTAGLFSAIFGTIFTASFGSSKTLVSGPSTGTAILIQTSISEILHTHYENVTGSAQDALVLSLLMQIVLFVGVIQIVAAFVNVSKLLQFVGRPVILGYFGGITVAVAIIQMFSFTGTGSPSNDDPLIFQFGNFFHALGNFQWTTFTVGFISLVIFVLARHYFKNWPYALLMLIIGALFSYAFNENGVGPHVKILKDLNLPENPVPEFTLPILNFKIFNKIFLSALAISLLSILEVFSISRTFAAKTRQKIQVNQDVFGLGLANLLLSFISGAMACSGSVTRTALNYRLFSKTRFSAVFSGMITMAVVFFFWPLVQHIPLTALAALLIASVHTLMDWKEIGLVFRASKEDAAVMIVTFLSCLFFSLDIAFFIGIILSIVSYLNRSAVPHLVEYAFNAKGRLTIINTRDDVYRKVRIIGIGGDLYFASADVFQSALQEVVEDPHVQAIVLRLNNVHHVDASMCIAVLHLHEILKESNRFLVITGLTEEVWRVFYRSGVVKAMGPDNLFFTDESNPQFSTWKGALRAQDLTSHS